MSVHHDPYDGESAPAAVRLRRGWQGCLLVVTIPVLVWLGVWVVQATFLSTTWQIAQAERAAISSDGQLVALLAGPMTSLRFGKFELGGYTTVEVRRAADRRLVRSLMTFPSERVVFAPDGHLLATAGLDGRIRTYADDGTLRATLEPPINDQRSIAFSPDGHWLAAGAAQPVVHIWRVQDGTRVRTLPAPAEVSSIAFSPDGQVLAAVAGDRVVLWNLATGEERRLYNGTTVAALAFSPDGTLLATGLRHAGREGNYGEVQLWRVTARDTQPERMLRMSSAVGALAFSPDGQVIAAGGRLAISADTYWGDWDLLPFRPIQLWRVSDGGTVQTLRSRHKEITSLLFSADGRTLFSTGVNGNWDGNLAIWRVDPWISYLNWLPLLSAIAAAGWVVWRRRGQR